MKIGRLFVIVGMLFSEAQAQYALKVVKQIIPIKNGDSISRKQLLSGQVFLLYLPDSLSPNTGINGIAFITSDKKGIASIHTVRGNNMLLPTSLTEPRKDTLIKSILIQQIWTKNNHIRQVKIRLTLIE